MENMRMEAKIILTYETEREARSVANAVSPDNLETPSGLWIKTTQKECKVLTHVRCKTRLETFTATLDDLLGAVSVAEKSFNVAKRFQSQS